MLSLRILLQSLLLRWLQRFSLSTFGPMPMSRGIGLEKSLFFVPPSYVLVPPSLPRSLFFSGRLPFTLPSEVSSTPMLTLSLLHPAPSLCWFLALPPFLPLSPLVVNIPLASPFPFSPSPLVFSLPPPISHLKYHNYIDVRMSQKTWRHSSSFLTNKLA